MTNTYTPEKVTVFGKPDCEFCTFATDTLTDSGIEFVYYSVEGPATTVDGIAAFAESGWTDRLPAVWFPGLTRPVVGAAVKLHLIHVIERYRTKLARAKV